MGTGVFPGWTVTPSYDGLKCRNLVLNARRKWFLVTSIAVSCLFVIGGPLRVRQVIALLPIYDNCSGR